VILNPARMAWKSKPFIPLNILKREEDVVRISRGAVLIASAARAHRKERSTFAESAALAGDGRDQVGEEEFGSKGMTAVHALAMPPRSVRQEEGRGDTLEDRGKGGGG